MEPTGSLLSGKLLQVAQIFPASYGTHRFITEQRTVPQVAQIFYFFSIHFIIIIFTPMPGSSKLSLSLRFPHHTGQNSISLLPCTSHNPHSPHPLSHDHVFGKEYKSHSSTVQHCYTEHSASLMLIRYTLNFLFTDYNQVHVIL